MHGIARRPPNSVAAWACLMAGVTASVSVGLTVAPLWTLLGLLAIASVVMATLSPKIAAAVAFLVLLASRELSIVTGIAALGYLDEITVASVVILFTTVRVVRSGSVRGLPGGRWFLVWIMFGIASSIAAQVPASLATESGYLSVKGVLFAFGLAQIDWTPEDIPKAAKFGAWLAILAFACACLEIVSPSRWAAVFSVTGRLDVRAFMPSLIGPFAHPGEFGLIASCVVIAALAWRSVHHRGLTASGLVSGGMLAALLSFRRKSIVGLLLASLLQRLKTSPRRTVLVLALTAPIAIFLAWSTLTGVLHYTDAEYLTNPDGAARIVLTRGAFSVAWHHFPFGAGFGRYGSYLAGVDYSPEYVSRGFPSVWGLGPTPVDGNALTDTQWPAAIGETGFFGALALLLALVGVYRRAGLLFRAPASARAVKWLGLVCMGWSIQFAIESTASAVYNSPPLYPLLFAVVGISAALPSRSGSEAVPEPGRSEVASLRRQRLAKAR